MHTVSNEKQPFMHFGSILFQNLLVNLLKQILHIEQKEKVETK